MGALPVRGAAVRELGLPLPPERMPPLRGGRVLKRWRYVGVFSPELMLCVGAARVGPLPQRWWALAWPDGTLREGSGAVELRPGSVRVFDGGVRVALELDDGAAVEVASPSGPQYIWTRKQGGVRARGTAVVDGREMAIDGEAIVDESAGYHERRTWWRWSAGVGRGDSGERVAWNLVTGVHDAPEASERTVWVDDEPREVGPVEFADDLSAVAGLRFSEWSRRRANTNLVVFRNRYVQPFGAFSGELPGGPRLAEGYGVMEEHDVRW
jgi:Protein of unknown function (DUF2804)